MAEMEYRRLGTTGMKVSAISIGAWLTYGSDAVEFDTAKDCLRAAIESGINFIDVADAYARGEAEKVVGQVIKDFERSSLVISTKAYWPMSDDSNDKGLSRKHLIESVEKSLKRFDMDYLDIFFCHRYDNDTPTDETVRAIEDMIRQGKILYWGTSMWEAHQIQEAVDAADKYNAYRPVVEQPKYNMLDREVVEGDLEAKVEQHGIGLVVFSPLAGGVLTGKYNEGVPEGSRGDRFSDTWMSENFSEHRVDTARALTAVAQEYGYEPSALALAWAIHHPNVDSVITGASKVSHVANNLKALDVVMSSDLEQKVEDILQNRPYNSHRAISTPDETEAI
jgi:voltage-dependent potassium channel beta subunit